MGMLGIDQLLPYQRLKKTTYTLPGASTKVAPFSPQRSVLVFWAGGIGGAIWFSCGSAANVTAGGASQTNTPIVITSGTHGILCTSEWYAATMGIGTVLDVYEVIFDEQAARRQTLPTRIPRIVSSSGKRGTRQHSLPNHEGQRS